MSLGSERKFSLRVLEDTTLSCLALAALMGMNYTLSDANPSVFLYLLIAPIVSGLFLFPAFGFAVVLVLVVVPLVDIPLVRVLAGSQAGWAAVAFLARVLVRPRCSGSLPERFLGRYGRMYRAILLLASGIPIFFIALFDMGRYAQALPYCLVVALHALAMPVPDPVRTISKTARVGSVALAGVSLLFSAALGEAGARLILPPEPTSGHLYMHSKDYLYLVAPNVRGKHHIHVGPKETMEIAINNSSLGIRDREYGPKDQDNEFRIVMLGDSHTMGHAVEIEDSIPRLLEAKLRAGPNGLKKDITVINVGIGGGGPWQHLGMWRERAISLEPDLVILQLFPSNDIENSLEEVGKRQRAYDVRWQAWARTWLRRGELPFRVEASAQRKSRLYREFNRATGDRQWFLAFMSRCRILPQYRVRTLPAPEDRPFFLEYNLAEWYPELNEGLERLKDYTRTLKEECNAEGVEIIAYCVPDLNEVDDELWNIWVTHTRDRATYERKKGITKVEAVLDELGIERFSVFDELGAHKPVDSIFYPLDGHMNGIGNGIVARKIRDVLREDYFPRHPELGLLPDTATPDAK